MEKWAAANVPCERDSASGRKRMVRRGDKEIKGPV